MGTEPVEYCREIERYLCQKNDGHLIRIVGPSFERVSAWAERGVPFKIACRGIDRYFERYYARGPRRRPVRIDFCEADVLDVFDEWRRAVGLPAGTTVAPAGVEEPAGSTERHGPSLPAHLERALLRLTSARASGRLDATFDDVLDRVARELDRARSAARGLRGEARQELLSRLVELDREMLAAARTAMAAAGLAQLSREADDDLTGFRSNMSDDAYARARSAAIDRLVRERFALPVLTFL